MRSAQAGLHVSHCDELPGAALHAARLRSLAWVVADVPLLKHRHIGDAVWRHAICQCTGEPKRGACYTALEVVRRTAKAGVVDCSGYSPLWAACALNAPPLLRW
jgi:hypothetical protein